MKIEDVTSTAQLSELLSPFERVRSSCARVAQNSVHVKYHPEEAVKFVENYLMPNLDDIKEKASKKSALPFNFDSVDHEANYRCLYGLLQFGSGYRKVLHQKAGRGAGETIERGLINCFLSEDPTISSLGVEMMEKVGSNYFTIEEYFQFPVKEEVPHELYPVIKVTQDTALKPLADSMKQVLTETARRLRERASDSFAIFIRKALAEYERKKDKEAYAAEVKDIGPAAFLVNQLVSVFPSALDDTANYELNENETIKVYLYKKAQLIVGELYLHLRHKDEIFNFSDIDQLTIFVDNVIPATLVKAGVLEIVDEEVKQKIANNKQLKHGSKAEVELRALSIYATEQIIKIISDLPYSSYFNTLHIDYFLWGDLGKQEDFRKFERHSTTNTVYY